MPKSLCLGWSCETGHSCNITTVKVFENSHFATSGPSIQYSVFIVQKCQLNCEAMFFSALIPSPKKLFCFSIDCCSLYCINGRFPFVFARWGCYAGRCSDRRQDHQGIVFIYFHFFKFMVSLFSCCSDIEAVGCHLLVTRYFYALCSDWQHGIVIYGGAWH